MAVKRTWKKSATEIHLSNCEENPPKNGKIISAEDARDIVLSAAPCVKYLATKYVKQSTSAGYYVRIASYDDYKVLTNDVDHFDKTLKLLSLNTSELTSINFRKADFLPGETLKILFSQNKIKKYYADDNHLKVLCWNNATETIEDIICSSSDRDFCYEKSFCGVCIYTIVFNAFLCCFFMFLFL